MNYFYDISFEKYCFKAIFALYYLGVENCLVLHSFYYVVIHKKFLYSGMHDLSLIFSFIYFFFIHAPI